MTRNLKISRSGSWVWVFVAWASCGWGAMTRGELFGAIPEKQYLMGKYLPSSHPQVFAKVPVEKTSGKEIWLRQDTLKAFLSMSQDAAKSGQHLWIISGFRSFSDQKGIWDNKFYNLFAKTVPHERQRVMKILEFSSMPGTSRHHWGTDLDLNSVNPEWWLTEEGRRLESWLVRNAPRFGFLQSYTAGRKAGYHEEKWHYSYKAASIPLLAVYLDTTTSKDLSGFAGCALADSVKIYEDFIMGINPELRGPLPQ